jgi:tetratricopeptide (TPR) repeat protein
LFITGQPGVGKSTFLLFLLDKCLTEDIGEWQKVFFLNPNAEKLKKSLKIIDGIMEEKSDEISPEDVLLVIDALHREEEEEYIDKCYDLFTKILEDKYSLVVTIRDSELAILKEKLGKRYKEFENIIEEAPVDPKKARIKQIFMNYLNYYKDPKIKIPDIDLSFEDITKYVHEGEIVSPEKSESYREFDKCIQKVVEKSEGVPGYVKYLMDDISRKGELSTEIIEKYPTGMTNLIRRIIERDYLIGDDKVLPLLILFLAKEKGHALTLEFLSSLIEWGVDVIDKTRFDNGVILERARNFINYYTADIRDGNITQYYLISHWREGIEDILKQRKVQKFTEIESELGDQILTYLAQKEEELKRGQLPVNLETWLVVADVAKLSYERKKMDVLEYATQFFIEHCDDTERCAFLKKTLSSLWQEKMDDELSAGDCENGVLSLENAIEVGIDDVSLHSRASDCYYEKGELSKALEHSQRAVELKPAEPTYLGKHGRILEREGVDLEGKGYYSEAISKFEDAVKSYEKAVEIIEGLSKQIKGERKRERNGYRWRIGYCNKRVTVIRRDLEHMDKEQLKEEAIRCFQESESYERKSNYNGALEKLKRAKELMLEYIDIEDELKDGVHELVSDIYKHIGICYELRKNGDREEAAENYMIYSDLNEYAPDSFEGFKKNGDKCLGWKFYDKARYCFRKALKSDQNNVEGWENLMER